MHILVIEVRSPDWSNAGYGRDVDEAYAHSGMNEVRDLAIVAAVEIYDSPVQGDELSARAAHLVCAWHINDDPETPTSVKARMQELLRLQAFATAMQYCFNVVWDRGFEDDPFRGQQRSR